MSRSSKPSMTGSSSHNQEAQFLTHGRHEPKEWPRDCAKLTYHTAISCDILHPASWRSSAPEEPHTACKSWASPSRVGQPTSRSESTHIERKLLVPLTCDTSILSVTPSNRRQRIIVTRDQAPIVLPSSRYADGISLLDDLCLQSRVG